MMIRDQNNNSYDMNKIIEFEIIRLTKKYNKKFLDCNDLINILGVGRDNVRTLMRSEDFPTMNIGNRKLVLIISFVIWQIEKDHLTYAGFRGNMTGGGTCYGR